MMVYAELVLHGCIWGSLYVLGALGLNLIYGVMKVLNIAHGELVMLGGYATFQRLQGAGRAPGPAAGDERAVSARGSRVHVAVAAREVAAPDAVVVLNIMPAGLYLTRQLRELGIEPKIYFMLIGPAYEKEFRAPLGRLAEGVLENGDWHPDLPFPGAKEFAAQFRGKAGKAVSFDAAFGWMGAQILAQAVEKAGTLDRAKITETLRRQEFMTVGGPYRYDEHGVNELQDRQNFLVQVQGGERVIVWPGAYATAKLRFPVFQR